MRATKKKQICRGVAFAAFEFNWSLALYVALSCVYQFINFEPGHQDVISDKNLHIVRKELSNYD